MLQVCNRKPDRWFDTDLGQNLVEFALILPLLLALTIGTADLARVVMTYNTLSNAAREGARYGIINPSDTTGIETQAKTLTTGLDASALVIVVSMPDSRSIEVNVSYNTPLITSFLIQAAGGSNTLPMSAVSRMQIE